MKRLLAVGVAALLVAGAIAVRDAIDDDRGDGAGSDGGEIVVACVRELATACGALEGVTVRVENPAATIDALLAEPGSVDAWVTLDPWPEIANLTAARDVIAAGAASVAVATTPLVLLVRRSAVPPGCNTAAWRCLVDGGARVHVPTPASALGLLVLGHAATDLFGGPFARQDLESPELADRLALLRRDVADPVEDMLLPLGTAGPQATGTTSADVETRVRPAPRGDDLATFPGAVPATVAVVVAGPAADRVAGDSDLHDALAALGYDVTDDAAARTTGLPSAGVLVALQELT